VLAAIGYHRHGSLHDVAYQPNGALLAVASDDCSVSLWRLHEV